MRGAGQAGVEGAHGDLDVVEQALGQGAPVQVARATARIARFMASLLCVVDTTRLARMLTWSSLVDPVMVDQRPARRLDHAHAARLRARRRHEFVAEKCRVVEQDRG
jgi:hypothetical protein